MPDALRKGNEVRKRTNHEEEAELGEQTTVRMQSPRLILEQQLGASNRTPR